MRNLHFIFLTLSIAAHGHVVRQPDAPVTYTHDTDRPKGTYTYLSAEPESLLTVSMPIPSQGAAFTSTVPACGTVPGYVLEGVPTGTFTEGYTTILAPPQASPTTTTYHGPNASYEIIIIEPLSGICAAPPFLLTLLNPPSPSTTSDFVIPTSTPDLCAGTVLEPITAQLMDLANEATLWGAAFAAFLKNVLTENDVYAWERTIQKLTEFTEIMEDRMQRLDLVGSPGPLTECDEVKVFGAFMRLADTHTQIAKLLLQKHSLLSAAPVKEYDAAAVAGNLAESLGELESATNMFMDKYVAVLGRNRQFGMWWQGGIVVGYWLTEQLYLGDDAF